MSRGDIVIKGAREHNLKNINLTLPRDKLIVITGLSGSGKSSLAFDTIYAEGQRRYVESLSAYARQFLGLMNKPDIDSIDGLSPAISIEQKTTSKNPRSTVGTVTEIYDYLRLLYARIGIPHCPKCGDKIEKQTADEIVQKVLKFPKSSKILIISPVIRKRKGEYSKFIADLGKKGYQRIRIDGDFCNVTDDFLLDKQIKHDIDIVVDRLIIRDGMKTRLQSAIEAALSESKGLVIIRIESEKNNEEILFSQNFACVKCDINLSEFTPRMFSFNNPFGACPSCHGLGVKLEINQDLIIPNKELSIAQGAIAPWSKHFKSFYMQRLNSIAENYGFDIYTPVKDMTQEQIDIVMHGSGEKKIKTRYEHKHSEGHWETFTTYEGVINNLKRLHRETKSEYRRKDIESYMQETPCHSCNGKRLKQEVLSVTIANKSISEVTDMSITEAKDFFTNIKLTKQEQIISKLILKETKERLNFLINVGLEYLTLSRSSGTLSGGESQRIRLATQIGANLMGVLYILDEPSIGLHQRDNMRLISTLKKLRDLGNTLIVVEHDSETILNSDYVVDIGPGAGVHGGYIVSSGTPQELMNDPKSITGHYLSGKKKISVPKIRKQSNGHYIEIKGANENNLKNIDISLPLGILTCITGVSGSGKSTLINETMYKALKNQIYSSREHTGEFKSITGFEHIDKVINIDQSPIGRTPRSNPATYTKVFDEIRQLFATTKEAKKRGYLKGRFSFNVRGGRCDACDGDGLIKIEMHFLPDIYVECEVCKGKRYNSETLEVKYKDNNIADILDMTVEDGLIFFENIPKIKIKMKTLNDVGLGYIKLGQSATTLSGGEAQRIKLASELSKRSTGKTLYLLDEPTTGLHTADIEKLLTILDKLKMSGNTIVVIEHNLDVIKYADYIIDLGPEGGDKGGEIIAEGTPEEVAKVKKSYTGQYLKKIL
ncbi:MAG: excinuclease ABC subunit UvrA [DPANN group archaeon]|nr:excinuclease ABC subunit UvrA [DPANN group archaeon]